MRKLILIAGLLAAAMPAAALAQATDDYVCLITYSTPEEATAGANDTALSGVYLSRAEADAQAAASGGVSAVWDYSTTYPDNADEEAFCEGPTFNPDDGEGGGNAGGTANPNSARDLAPGQIKGEGESARDHAPGQVKEEGESAKESAPGQQKNN